ncbi:MAG: DUF5652 family protein [Candidatus Paceibacterota bacterium]|jgi:methionyl-tRNA synthetase
MHGFSPLYSPFGPEFMLAFLPILMVMAVWTIILKGFALWHAARSNQSWWFVAILIVNTLGILEIVYLIWFRPTSPYSHTSRHPHTPAHDSSPAQV